MSFTTPPTFVDGDALSASQLNILAANQNYLSGIATSTNVGFAKRILTDGDPTQEYLIVHMHDYLYVRCNVPNSDTGIKVYYNSTEVYHVDGDSVTGDVNVNIDISGFGLVAGTRYTLKFTRVDEDGDTAAVTVFYAAEVSETI